jgi:ankyrin repeat protein
MKTRDKITIAGFVLILLITGVLYLVDRSRTNNPFIQAVREGNISVVQECIQADRSIVNRPSPLSRSTPLHEAAAFGQNEVVLLLLDNGATIDAERDARRTPLHMAVFHGHAKTVELLASRGANINHLAWRHNNSPLQVAVANKHTDVVRLLLDLNADTTIRDMNGDTALDDAEEMGLTNIVELLSGPKTRIPNQPSEVVHQPIN